MTSKDGEMVWLVYNTSITDGNPELDYHYLFSMHKDFKRAMEDKKECQAFQKKYAGDRLLKDRVYIRKFWLQN